MVQHLFIFLERMFNLLENYAQIPKSESEPNFPMMNRNVLQVNSISVNTDDVVRIRLKI